MLDVAKHILETKIGVPGFGAAASRLLKNSFWP